MMKSKIIEYIYAIIGILLASLSFNLLLSPYNLVSGGVDGLAIIYHHIFGVNESIFILIFNIFLIIESYFILGRNKTRKSILGSILYPIMIHLTTPINNLISFSDIDKILLAVIAGLISGVGLGLVYKYGFNTGGTDILESIMQKKANIPLNKAILIIDGSIVLLSILVFGINTTVYSLITIFIISHMANKTVLEQNENKVIYIHTSKVKEVKKLLNKTYQTDVTIFDSIGGFTELNKKIIMCSVSNKNYYAIKESLKLIDKHIFIITANSYEQQNANKSINRFSINT